jgi:MFS family permease
MVDVLASPQQAKSDNALRTLVLISAAHWVSHFHLLVLPMLFPFLKAQLGVGYIELGFALTVFAVISGLTQAPMGYLADHIGARNILLIGLPSLLLTAVVGTAGFLGGVIAPSRDMLVRNAAPAGAAGRAFGIVSTG